MTMLTPPYYAVIFTSLRTEVDEGYTQTAQRMLDLAGMQNGFLHVDSVRENGHGITVSYWRDLDSIHDWKQQIEHIDAQHMGKEKWYLSYQIRICKVEREYEFGSENKIV